ncbi:hypothetical protein IV203_014929 [Nitzschia inconspicua]|uniref:Transmembrane protein n=1 Tax=Nitzschia inconspicua TaxID=303405 RepID=A0A9K3LBS6_9STRA|nr:hypothetical protein IV203_014929 [Nitzschia inconspicua]
MDSDVDPSDLLLLDDDELLLLGENSTLFDLENAIDLLNMHNENSTIVIDPSNATVITPNDTTLLEHYFESSTLPPHLDQCSVATRTFQDEIDWRGHFDEVPFVNTRAIRIAHFGPQRFGRPSNIELLWRSTYHSDRKDYIMGIAATCITLLVLFCIWLVVLLVLKYLGPQRVTFLSGRFPPLPENHTVEMEKQDDTQEDNVENESYKDATNNVLCDGSSSGENLHAKKSDEGESVETFFKSTVQQSVAPNNCEDLVNNDKVTREVKTNDEGIHVEQIDTDKKDKAASSSEVEVLSPTSRNKSEEFETTVADRDVTDISCMKDEVLDSRNRQTHDIVSSFVQRIQNPFALFDPFLLQNCNALWTDEQQLKQREQEQRQRSDLALDSGTFIKEPQTIGDVTNDDNTSNGLIPKRATQIWRDIHNIFSVRIPPDSEDDSSDRSSFRELPQHRLSSSLRSRDMSSHRNDGRDLSIPDESSNEFFRKEESIVDRDNILNDSFTTPKEEEYPNDNVVNVEKTETSDRRKPSTTRLSSIFFSAKEEPSHESSLNQQDTMEDDAIVHTREDHFVQSWSAAHVRQRRQLRISQAAVVLSGVGIIITSILMAFSGVNGLLKTMNESIKLLDHDDGLASQGIVMIDDVIRVVGKTENHTGNAMDNSAIYQLLVDTEGEICGGVAVEQVCRIWADQSGVVSAQRCLNEWGRTNELLRLAFRESFRIANDGLQAMLLNLEGVRNDLLSMSQYIYGVEKSIKNFQWAFGVARALNLILALLCVLILLGVFCHKWSRLTRCLQSWITIPLFCTLVLLSFIFSLVCILLSTTLADFCINGPDSRVLSIADLLKEDITDIIHDFAIYYVKQCPLEFLPESYTFYMRLAWTFVSGLFRFAELLVLAEDPVTEYCRLGDQDTILQVSALFQEFACDLSALLADTIVFFQCQNWFPLYEQGVYNAMCYSGTSSIVWIAITQVMTVVFAAVMLTFRVGFAKLPEAGDETTQSNGGGSSAEMDSKIDDSI